VVINKTSKRKTKQHINKLVCINVIHVRHRLPLLVSSFNNS